MIPTSHIFEGTADNYPFRKRFEIKRLKAFEGSIYQDDELRAF